MVNKLDRRRVLTTFQVLLYLYPFLLSAVSHLEQEVGDEGLHYYWYNDTTKIELTRTSFDA